MSLPFNSVRSKIQWSLRFRCHKVWGVMHSFFLNIFILLVLSAVFLSSQTNAQERAHDKRLIKTTARSVFKFENEQLRLRLRPRTTAQMAGFFEARGFPKVMINELSQYCFFTVGVKNKTTGELQLDLSAWEFKAAQNPVKRLPRSVWPPMWKELNIPMASQSTFRWTLLPERLNFYAQEGEGGNIILQKTEQAFSLKARFEAGKDKQVVEAVIDDIQCADVSQEKQ